MDAVGEVDGGHENCDENERYQGGIQYTAKLGEIELESEQHYINVSAGVDAPNVRPDVHVLVTGSIKIIPDKLC